MRRTLASSRGLRISLKPGEATAGAGGRADANVTVNCWDGRSRLACTIAGHYRSGRQIEGVSALAGHD